MSDEAPTAEGHCWHMRKGEMKGRRDAKGLIRGPDAYCQMTEKCCWCAAERVKKTRSQSAAGHGPHCGPHLVSVAFSVKLKGEVECPRARNLAEENERRAVESRPVPLFDALKPGAS